SAIATLSVAGRFMGCQDATSDRTRFVQGSIVLSFVACAMRTNSGKWGNVRAAHATGYEYAALRLR
ncbi:MAG: hypothetical protein ACRD2L_16980, partial [Terriglobia bacterium]